MTTKPDRLVRAGLALVVAAALAPASVALDEAEFENNLTVRTLDNGLTLMIYERPIAPIVSCFLHVNVGSVHEVPGITGLAHMFEHMAFKGTSIVGTTDAKAERKALVALDDAYDALDAARRATDPDPERIAALETAFERAQEAAAAFVVQNEFDEIVSRAGGSGLNAFTASDETGYILSLPANKLELWAYLESERFIDPVFREFYKERDVVQEERRLRMESTPFGRMLELVLGTAFAAHPYKQPGIGYMSDLQSITRRDAREFFDRNYAPSRMTAVVVGDVDAKRALPMLEKYFSRIPNRPGPRPVRTVEPVQKAEKTIVLPDPTQPLYAEAYHRPAASHPDDAVFSAIEDILSNGRTARLNRALVQDARVAAAAGVFNGLPGTRYPHLVTVFAVPTPDADNDRVQAALRDELDRLKNEPVEEAELVRFRTRARAGLIRGLQSNMGIGFQLAQSQAHHGTWREMFRRLERIDAVTADDIRRVASATFVATNRTVVRLENTTVATSEEEGS